MRRCPIIRLRFGGNSIDIVFERSFRFSEVVIEQYVSIDGCGRISLWPFVDIVLISRDVKTTTESIISQLRRNILKSLLQRIAKEICSVRLKYNFLILSGKDKNHRACSSVMLSRSKFRRLDFDSLRWRWEGCLRMLKPPDVVGRASRSIFVEEGIHDPFSKLCFRRF